MMDVTKQFFFIVRKIYNIQKYILLFYKMMRVKYIVPNAGTPNEYKPPFSTLVTQSTSRKVFQR